MQVIDARDFSADQSWCRTTIIEVEGHRLRTSIRYNAFSFQSHGRVERWDGAKWQEVASIPYPELEGVLSKVSYVQAEAPVEAFNIDEDALFDIARRILGIAEAIPSELSK